MIRIQQMAVAIFLLLLISFAGTTIAQKPRPAIVQKSPTKALSAKEIAKSVLPSVVLLICDDPETEGYTQGSGFFIKPGILITNYHVIKGNKRGVVQIASGDNREKKTFRIARVVNFDEDSDLALLSVPSAKTANVPFLPLFQGNENIEVGETVYALGNPEGMVGTISPGIISANIRSTLKRARLQISAPISHGSSGGPIVNDRGQVIGVAVSTLSEGQNLNFAVPSSLVLTLLSTADLPDDFTNFKDTQSDKDAKSLALWSWGAQMTQVSKPSPPVRIIGPTRAGETEAVASLRKLAGVYVVVEGLSSDGKRITSDSQLQTEVELRLRRNRIRVLSEAEWLNSPGFPYLYVRLTVIQNTTTGLYSYDYAIQLKQRVLLGRDRTFEMSATTWETGSVGYAGAQVAGSSVTEAISSAVDEFCNDFLKANSP